MYLVGESRIEIKAHAALSKITWSACVSNPFSVGAASNAWEVFKGASLNWSGTLNIIVTLLGLGCDAKEV